MVNLREQLGGEKASSLFAIRTTTGQEKKVAYLIGNRIKTLELGSFKAILVPEQLNGYVFVEAIDPKEVQQVCLGLPHIRGKPIGRIHMADIEHFFLPRFSTKLNV